MLCQPSPAELANGRPKAVSSNLCKSACAVTVIIFALVIGVFGPLGTRAAFAQSTGPAEILADGNAVVTGFSGSRAASLTSPQTVAVGTDAADQVEIDLAGPSARIVDLQSPGEPPHAQLLNAPKPFTAAAAQIGQVFAVALDNATPPNIYLAATSAYGLPIVVPGMDGEPVRTKQGGPNAQFMPGLFGPTDLEGGPGSIWRIDGVTGEIRLFTNVTLDGVTNSGPALGGLAFDPASNTLFVADRDTGMIHRFDLSGVERGRFDHGVEGRAAVDLPAVAFDPTKRLDITNPQFDSEDPATWGYAPAERLVFGLAVRGNRLYYAVADGLQIWSVAILADGSFGLDARIELQIPPWDGRSEISKIIFDDEGRMVLAERAAPTGAYDFRALAQEGVARVLRYQLVRSTSDPAGSRWQPDPDEYAIGFAGQLRNSNGGVAVGYHYADNGSLDRSSCGGFLWASGEQLRNSPDPELATQLASGGPLIVNGLQGNASSLVRPGNMPPLATYFIDYDDTFNDEAERGHLGDVAIRRGCGQRFAVEVPVPLGNLVVGPEWPVCRPFELKLGDGWCCDRAHVRDGRCWQPPRLCPAAEFRVDDGKCCDRSLVRQGRCLPPPTCPRGTIQLPNGRCCDRDNVRDGKCGPPPPACPPGTLTLRNGSCCNPDRAHDGKCQPPPPPPCPPGTVALRDSGCNPPPPPCAPGTVALRGGGCNPPPSPCSPGEVRLSNGQCQRQVRYCGPGSIFQSGHCVPSYGSRPLPKLGGPPRLEPPRHIERPSPPRPANLRDSIGKRWAGQPTFRGPSAKGQTIHPPLGMRPRVMLFHPGRRIGRGY